MPEQSVLIAPLNWGLGHATRCVPVIRKYIEMRYRVVIAADGNALEWLKIEFPEIKAIELPGFRIKYSPSGSQFLAMIRQLPSIIAGTIREHYRLQQIIRQENIHIVISDNRFGLWNKRTHSIYITHQLLIRAPQRWMETPLRLIHRWIINHFDECWIPDVAKNENLAGDLAHKYPLPPNAKFIGWLSRFPYPLEVTVKKNYTNLCLISGPEPHRTLFEQSMIERFKRKSELTLIVCGQPSSNRKPYSIGNVDLLANLSGPELQYHLLNTPHIFCRSGYSTLMDLKALNREATLFPTPGQPEQEYLFGLHQK